MMAIWIYVTVIGLLYFLLIAFILYGWIRTEPFISKEINDKPFVSIIIPVRNESSGLCGLLSDLGKQDYPYERFEIIIADDHSEGLPENAISEISHTNKIRILHLDTFEKGKKAALMKALQVAESELVLTTDADCRLQSGWISEMAGYFSSGKVKLMFGNVRLSESRKIMNWFQSLEFLSLVVSGEGMAGAGHPILCNAANMGFEKSTYLQFLREEGDHLPVSGDDVIFLLWLKKKYPGKIGFVKSLNARVETSPARNMKEFIQQRLRWTSKSRHYRDFMMIITSLIVYFTSMSLLILMAGSIFSMVMMKSFFGLFLLKCTTDFILLFIVTGFYQNRYLLTIFFPLEIIYFIYISIIGLTGNLIGFTWKGRKIKPGIHPPAI
jgi:cellulose synthase/poly-beta-1,6-N-acetylglucosamine synthase-like glycosyltransferase